MKLRNSVNGNVPFEGDRTFKWQAIPANAKILSAVATVTPVDSKLSSSPFTELLSFRNGTGDFGATKSNGTASSLPWVEVDFHSRRTLAGVTGSFGTVVVISDVKSTGGSTLQVDVGGGTYVEINQNGAFRTSDPPDSFFTLEGSTVDLPGLTVAKLKVTSRTATPPTLTTLTMRSVPTQVSLRVGDLPPFWTHVGEMTNAETTPDFAAVLQAALTTAKVENGFYDLPITIHSDSIARLKVELEVEALAQQDVLPKAVPEVTLPFDASTLSRSPASEFTIEVPANSRVVPGETTVHVRGAFDETRVASGPTGEDKPTAAIEVSPAYSQAQIIALENEVAAVAVDLLLEALTPSARLQLDIRGDFDGKPDEIPLLPGPVEFRIEQQAGKGATWTSVPLPSEFLFAKAGEKSSRYWLLLQSIEGRAAWTIEQVPETPPTNPAASYLPFDAKGKAGVLNVQRTLDGGLSWQDTTPRPGTLLDKNATPPFVALLRLRNKPQTFKMPIKLQVGSGDNSVTKTLERFEPLGRVDFTLDTELAEGINKYLERAGAGAVPETQHLINADFERWERLGEQMASRSPIECEVRINGVAFSPDGELAYVLDHLVVKEGFLLLLDVACNKKIEKRIKIDLIEPRAFSIHPDGTRAYVTNGRNVQVLSLESQGASGAPLEVFGATGEPARTLTLSPDGRRLYLVNLNSTTGSSPKKHAIRIIETAILEQPATSDRTITSPPDVENLINEEPSGAPVAVAVSPDESRLYMLFETAGGGFLVRFIDIPGFTPSSTLPSVQVGPEATSLALTPDGKTLVVTNMNGDSVSIIDTTSRDVVVLPDIPPPDPPVPPVRMPRLVALSADGNHAYVFNQGTPRSIDTIDINSRKVLGSFTLQDGISADNSVAMALSPQGDQIYIVNSSSNTVSSIQFGTRVPSEWQRTSGDVQPVCFPNFHQVALLGSALLPTSISQVVPVAESFPYEFSFWGIAAEPIADEPPAIAEVLWLNDACGLLQTDSVLIETIDVDDDMQPREFPLGLARGATERAPLVFHRLTTRKVNGETKPLTSPEGAEQAEVRFSVGKGAAAAIDLVSLSATSELLANGDFKLQKEGQLIGWTLVTDMTGGFSFSALEEGLRLSNAGGATVELVQTVAAESERPFTIEFQGTASAGPAAELPRVELRWLKANGSTAGEPAILKLQPDGLDSAIASGTVAKESANVEIHLVAPPKTTIEVKRISLQYARTTKVPVKFISEAPGDMTVSDVRVSFQEVPPQAPPLRNSASLCTATPPGREPGEKGSSCYCHQCEEETEMTEMMAVTTPEGRPATMARCSTCRTRVLSVGGPVVADAQPLPLRQTMAPRPVIVRTATLARPSAPVQMAVEVLRLTDIHGIGEARAKQLTDIGIDSVEKLAASPPESVAKIKFITPKMASQIIAQAKSRLTGP